MFPTVFSKTLAFNWQTLVLTDASPKQWHRTVFFFRSVKCLVHYETVVGHIRLWQAEKKNIFLSLI